MVLNRSLLLLLLLSLHPLHLFSLSGISFTEHVLFLLSSHLKIVALLLQVSFAKVMFSDFPIANLSQLALAVHVLGRLMRQLVAECGCHTAGVCLWWRCVVLWLLVLRTLGQICDRQAMVPGCAGVMERLRWWRKYWRSLRLSWSPA